MPSDNPNTILQLNKSKTQHVQPSAPMISHSHISSSTLPQQPASPTIKTLSRARTISSTDSGETDSVTDLHKPLKLTNSAIIKPDNRRNSDLNKTHLHGKYSLQLSDERRNSTPALHLSTLSSLHFSTLFKKKHKQQKETDSFYSTMQQSNKYEPENRRQTVSVFITDDQRLDSIKREKQSSTPPPSTPSVQSSVAGSIDGLDNHSRSDSQSTISSTSFVPEISRHDEPCSVSTIGFSFRAQSCVHGIYTKYFINEFHTNYYGEHEREGLFVVSIRYYPKISDSQDTIIPDLDDVVRQTSVNTVLAIVRTQSETYFIQQAIDNENEDNVLQKIFQSIGMHPLKKLQPVGDYKAADKISHFDKRNDERLYCKVGVYYQKSDQRTENEILSNGSQSKYMEEFLDLIALKVPLKGFRRYKGDLDVKEDLHGKQSYHTSYRGYEIMFNVAPMIPSPVVANGEYVERKALPGNSFVCIIFQDPGASFNPDIMAGRVNQVYITVQPTTIASNSDKNSNSIPSDQLYYKIEVWRRPDVPCIEPYGGTFKHDEHLRYYMLTLILNCVCLAVESPLLKPRIQEPKKRAKNEDLKILHREFINSMKLLSPSVQDLTETENHESTSSVNLTFNQDQIEPPSSQTQLLPVDNYSSSKPRMTLTRRLFNVIGGGLTKENKSNTNSHHHSSLSTTLPHQLADYGTSKSDNLNTTMPGTGRSSQKSRAPSKPTHAPVLPTDHKNISKPPQSVASQLVQQQQQQQQQQPIVTSPILQSKQQPPITTDKSVTPNQHLLSVDSTRNRSSSSPQETALSKPTTPVISSSDETSDDEDTDKSSEGTTSEDESEQLSTTNLVEQTLAISSTDSTNPLISSTSSTVSNTAVN